MENKTKANRRNNLYTLSYFRKRLHDVDFTTEVLVSKYLEGDKRYWTILVNKHIVCTCFKFIEDSEHKVYFNFSDGKQKIPFDTNKSVESMQVIVAYLNEVLGVVK